MLQQSLPAALRGRLAGPCEVCGKALGSHSRRALRQCQGTRAEVEFMAVLLGVGATLFRILHDPKRFERDVAAIADTYTAGIRELTNGGR